MAIGISRFIPLQTQAPSKSASTAPVQAQAPVAQGGPENSTDGAQSAASSASNLLQGLVGSYIPKLSLTPEQMQEIKAAAPTLQKLAGADGKWGPSDLANNVQAVGGGIVQRTLVESQLRKGFEEMTGKPVPSLTNEEKTAARDRWDKMTPEERKSNQISVKQLKQVGSALNSVKDSTPLTKLAPKGDGISGNMLQKLGEKQNPNVMDLMQAQKAPASEAASDAKGGSEASKDPAATDPSAPSASASDSPAADSAAPDSAPPDVGSGESAPPDAGDSAPSEAAPPPEPAAPDQP